MTAATLLIQMHKAKAARRGDAVYHRDVRPHVDAQHVGEIFTIDLHSGDREADPDEITAARRLESRHPDAQIWAVHGSRYLARFLAGQSNRTVA